MECQDKLEQAKKIVVLSGYAKECETCCDIIINDSSKNAYSYAGFLFKKEDELVSIFSDRKEMLEYIKQAIDEIPEECSCDIRRQKEDRRDND